MRKHFVSLFSTAVLALLGTTSAHADVVSERVILRGTLAACPSGAGYQFVREIQSPDGKYQTSSGPIVPMGYLLDITDVSYQPGPVTTPYPAAFNLVVQNVADPRYRVQFLEDQIVGAPSMRHVQFSTGQLMGPGGRLCWSSTWGTYQPTLFAGAQVVVRGRLIPSGTILATPLPSAP
jgi:hypothetical protein